MSIAALNTNFSCQRNKFTNVVGTARCVVIAVGHHGGGGNATLGAPLAAGRPGWLLCIVRRVKRRRVSAAAFAALVFLVLLVLLRIFLLFVDLLHVSDISVNRAAKRELDFGSVSLSLGENAARSCALCPNGHKST